MRLGQDPIKFLDQGNEDYLISQAIVSVALETMQKEKVEEVKAVSRSTAAELARIIAPLMRF